MKTFFILATFVTVLHSKTYKMETRSSGSLLARLIKANADHKYLEEKGFHHRQVLKKKSQPLIDYRDNFSLGTVTIGTPGQTLSLLIDIASSYLWVIDAACKTEYCNGRFDVTYTRRKFHATKSSTFSSKNNTIIISEQYGSCKGDLVMDTVSFAGLTIKEQEFSNVVHVDGMLGVDPLDGYLGLGWPSEAAGKVTPPMQNLLPSLDEPLFTFWMDRHQTSGANDGLIVYGAIDTTNCRHSHVGYVQLASNDSWQFHLEGFSIGTFSTSNNTELVKIESSSSWIVAPQYIFDAVVEQTGAYFDITYGIYMVDCSTITTQPDLVFSINGLKYSVESENYVLDFNLGKEKCVLGLYATGSGDGTGFWSFGNPWLRAYCNIFDIGQNRIGFAKAIHSRI